MDKNSLANAGDTGSIPGPGRLYMLQSNRDSVPPLLKPECPRAHTPQLLSHMRQTLKPAHLEPVLCSKRSHCTGKPTWLNEEQPLLATTREGPCAAKKTQCSQNLKKKISHPEKRKYSTNGIKLDQDKKI